MNMILCCFMGVTAVVDIIRREIPGWMFLAGGIAGVAGRVASNMAGMTGGVTIWQIAGGIAASMAVGIVLLAISYIVSGAIGAGDGWFFAVTGLYVPWNVNLGLLFYGLILCCIYGSILTVWGAVKGISVRKKKIPFLPFVAAAGILMYTSHMWLL